MSAKSPLPGALTISHILGAPSADITACHRANGDKAGSQTEPRSEKNRPGLGAKAPRNLVSFLLKLASDRFTLTRHSRLGGFLAPWKARRVRKIAGETTDAGPSPERAGQGAFR